MRDLVDRFNGSYVLAIAAYNAGPGRVREWLQANGDPRAEGADVVDWIEFDSDLRDAQLCPARDGSSPYLSRPN